MVARQIHLLKSRGITAMATTLVQDDEASGVGMSSLIDTWLLLRNVESNGERNRLLFVLKSRGTAHSNQVREFVLTDHGVELADVYVGPGGVMMVPPASCSKAGSAASSGARGAADAP